MLQIVFMLSVISPSIFSLSTSNYIDVDDLKQGVFYDLHEHNLAKSFVLLKRAADAGNAIAQGLVGDKFLDGEGVAKNIAKAYYYFNMAASQGDMEGLNGLGICYRDGLVVNKDVSKAVELFRQSAAKKYAVAYMNLGQVYYLGQAGTKDIPKGIKLFTKAAELGEPRAQYRLAAIYQVGNGVAPNLVKSFMWYKLAELNGYDKAKNNYFETHKAKGLKQVPYCYALGQNNVSVMYSQGSGGLKKSDKKAFAWMQKAYTTDPTVAVIAYNLAKMYESGRGVAPDFNKVLGLAQKAAKTPYGPAQQYLANLYLNGSGVAQDNIQAYAWLLLAKYTFTHRDNKYYKKYNAVCQPGGESDALQNADVVQAQLDALKPKLSIANLQKAEQLFQILRQKQHALT